MKYQFTIRLNNERTNNSAATKAMVDCNTIFSNQGYEDYSLYYTDTSNRIKYSLSLIYNIIRFYLKITPGSIIGTQYPLLNNIFKYFIKAAKRKKSKVFCIIHDIESLRLGAKDKLLVNKELKNLNYYDCLIVHNQSMENWLRNNGVTTKMVPLVIFDYLLAGIPDTNITRNFDKTIVFAGNLEKSTFIYSLQPLESWKFNVYGPNFLNNKPKVANLVWKGVYTPEEVAYKLDGDFGLIWDGEDIDKCDEVLGMYLNYNNPHKFSLYIAAGLPVIAPMNSAIGKVIKEHKIGILIDSLSDLNKLEISESEHDILKANCNRIRHRIVSGEYLTSAIKTTEKLISQN